MIEAEAGAMTARRLILSLLNAVGADTMSVARMVAAGAALGFEDAAMRMAAARLLKQGLLESPERGVYASGESATRLRDRVRGWRGVRDRRTEWAGDWLAMPGGHFGRSDRKRLAARERALRLHGFAEAAPGLWMRPANLAVDLDALRERLIGLGLDKDAMLWRIEESAAPASLDLAALWDTSALEARYREMIAALEDSMAGLADRNPAEAARETLLLGQAAIRAINLDPLLPDAMVDHALFEQLVAAMEDYDRCGKRAWAAFYAAAKGPT